MSPETFWRQMTAEEQAAAAQDAGVRLSFETYGFDLATHETPTSRHLAAMRAEQRRVRARKDRLRRLMRSYRHAVAQLDREFEARAFGTWPTVLPDGREWFSR